jgi:hypothetical protein
MASIELLSPLQAQLDQESPAAVEEIDAMLERQ